MEIEFTLETLIDWHQQRAQEIMATMARATHVPKQEREAMTSMAKFHQAAVRLSQTLEL
jgi:hypothetical protein